MNEAELLIVASEALDRMWSLVQWWASISFGLLVVAHIASDRIGIYLAVLISLLYTLFTVGVGAMTQRNFGIVESVYGDLLLLQKSGIELSITANYMMAGHSSIISLALPLAVVMTYAGVLGYFLYSYRKRQHGEST